MIVDCFNHFSNSHLFCKLWPNPKKLNNFLMNLVSIFSNPKPNYINGHLVSPWIHILCCYLFHVFMQFPVGLPFPTQLETHSSFSFENSAKCPSHFSLSQQGSPSSSLLLEAFPLASFPSVKMGKEKLAKGPSWQICLIFIFDGSEWKT